MASMNSVGRVKSWGVVSLLVVGSVLGGAAMAAEGPLVRAGAAGAFEPGLVSAWAERTGGVSLTLAGEVGAAEVASLLGDRVAGIAVEQRGAHELWVTGMPLTSLLAQLSRLSFGESVDPLADLAGIGGAVVAMQRPEAGGSIRASRPTDLPGGDAASAGTVLFDAKVVAVERGAFPRAQLKLKVVHAPQVAELRTKLRRGTTFDAQVQLASAGDVVDYASTDNQRNVVGYFLLPGDVVGVQVVEREGKLVIVAIERRVAK
ncbi:MAG: hypothetical protein AAB426_00185 [Myxococcota bacterium]